MNKNKTRVLLIKDLHLINEHNKQRNDEEHNKKDRLSANNRILSKIRKMFSFLSLKIVQTFALVLSMTITMIIRHLVVSLSIHFLDCISPRIDTIDTWIELRRRRYKHLSLPRNKQQDERFIIRHHH